MKLDGLAGSAVFRTFVPVIGHDNRTLPYPARFHDPGSCDIN